MSEKSVAILGAEKLEVPEVSFDLADLVWTRGCAGGCTGAGAGAGAGRRSSLEAASSLKSSDEEDMLRSLESEKLKF